MHYVYLTDNVVTDQCQVDPFNVFAPDYADEFIEAPDEVTFSWSLIDGQWQPPPGPTPQEIAAQNKAQASALLTQTDWTTIPDVADPAKSNPYLANQNEFVVWRNEVRQVAINPPETPYVFTNPPDEIWSTI